MFHVVYYRDIPEIWEIQPHEDILVHLGANYGITGKSFHKKESAKNYIRDLKIKEEV